MGSPPLLYPNTAETCTSTVRPSGHIFDSSSLLGIDYVQRYQQWLKWEKLRYVR